MCFNSLGTMPGKRFVRVKKKKDGPVGELLCGDVSKFAPISQTQQQNVTDFLHCRLKAKGKTNILNDCWKKQNLHR